MKSDGNVTVYIFCSVLQFVYKHVFLHSLIAALLALEILAVGDLELSKKLKAKRENDSKKVLEKDRIVCAKFNA